MLRVLFVDQSEVLEDQAEKPLLYVYGLLFVDQSEDPGDLSEDPLFCVDIVICRPI